MALLRTRQSLSTTRLTESKEILALLEKHPAFQKAKTILLYYSLDDEIDTHSFVARWGKLKNIILPKVIGNELDLKKYDGPENLEKGAYGIQEPAGESFLNYSEIDLAVIPGVAFDIQGNRLGRGKGYYDRLLPKLSAYKIGICFPFQLVEEVPVEQSDISMDEVLTLGI